MTRIQRDAVILRNLPATEATLAHLLSSAANARQSIEELAKRGQIELVGNEWRRTTPASDIRTFRRSDALR